MELGKDMILDALERWRGTTDASERQALANTVTALLDVRAESVGPLWSSVFYDASIGRLRDVLDTAFGVNLQRKTMDASHLLSALESSLAALTLDRDTLLSGLRPASTGTERVAALVMPSKPPPAASESDLADGHHELVAAVEHWDELRFAHEPDGDAIDGAATTVASIVRGQLARSIVRHQLAQHAPDLVFSEKDSAGALVASLAAEAAYVLAGSTPPGDACSEVQKVAAALLVAHWTKQVQKELPFELRQEAVELFRAVREVSERSKAQAVVPGS